MFLNPDSSLIFSGLLKSQDIKINKEDFFPFSVWYSGGKARATMLSEITSNSREEWKRDIQQIKSLGFNSVKTWVEMVSLRATKRRI